MAFAEKNNDSTLYTTKKFITGTAMRGCLAQLFIDFHRLGEDAHKNNDFYDIFLSGKVRFLPAYPLGSSNKKDNVQPFILPLSMMKHKTDDDIIDLTDEKTQVQVGYKKLTGFALKNGDKIYKVEPKTKIQLHIARTKDSARITGSSKDGDIFNYEYIERGQYFKGSFIVDDDVVDKFIAKLSEMNIDKIHLGRSRHTQYGSCKFELKKVSICRFDEIDINRPFYIYAYTPYIPFHEWQRTDEIAAQLLAYIKAQLKEKRFELTEDNKDRIKIFAASEDIGGYIKVWHARHERKNALSAGSLIKFNLKGIDEAAMQVLKDILLQGAGLRTVEGFGQFRLWQADDAAELAKEEALVPTRPGNLKLVVKKAYIILRQRILIELKKEAEHVSKINPVSKKHILNRIEGLMDSSLTKKEIIAEIQEFKDAAKNNLKNIYVGDADLYDILTEEKGYEQPYAKINWDKRLRFKHGQAQDIEKDLGKDIFLVDEEMAYKHFWLWFARHAKKKLNDKD